MFYLLARRLIDAASVVGNIFFGLNFGSVVQNFYAGAPPQEPTLLWDTLPAAPDEVFRMLSWRVRLTSLVGREADLSQLHSWANGTTSPRVRILSGPGGSGKTRLAAEFASRLRDDGWTAGFWRLDQPAVFPISQRGLLLILDYPEEGRDAVLALLKNIALSGAFPAPVRVLLLSRMGLPHWSRLIDAAGAAHLVDEQAAEVGQLQTGEASTLLKLSVAALSRHFSIDRGEFDESTIADWLDVDPGVHLLPLMIRAAAIHAILEPGADLSLGGSQIISDLVRRERRRMDGNSVAAGLPIRTIARLVALAGLPGALTVPTIKGLCDGEPLSDSPAKADVIDRLADAGALKAGRIDAVVPDLLAAELLCQTLAERPDVAPEWIWLVISNSASDLIDRLGRLLNDIQILHPTDPSILQTSLLTMLKGDPARALVLAPMTHEDRLPVTLSLFAERLAETLIDVLQHETDRGAAWSNLSNHQSQNGKIRDAIASATNAVGIARGLNGVDQDTFDHALVNGLHNLAIHQMKSSLKEDALRSSREAAAILRAAHKRNPTRFAPSLANCLNTLSNAESDAGYAADALSTAIIAIRLHCSSYRDKSAQQQPQLSGLLQTLSSRQMAVGRLPSALRSITKSVRVLEQLAKDNPLRFEAGYAAALHRLALCQRDNGDIDGATKTLIRATELYRKLRLANTDGFTHNLASCLHNLSNLQAKRPERRQAALDNIKEAISLRCGQSGRETFFLPDLARNFISLSDRLSEMNRFVEAPPPMRKAIDLLRGLYDGDVRTFKPDLAKALFFYAVKNCQAGVVTETEESAREAVDLYSQLAAEGKEDALLWSAKSTGLLAHIKFSFDRLEESLALIDQAIAIIDLPAIDKSLDSYSEANATLLSQRRQIVAAIDMRDISKALGLGAPSPG
jgi:tetratricopeptide (TPR) repeat protein